MAYFNRFVFMNKIYVKYKCAKKWLTSTKFHKIWNRVRTV